MSKPQWLHIKASEDGKSTTIDINDFIGYDWFTGEGITKKSIAAELKQIGAVKGDVIVVNINSYGGDVNDGVSIHDLLAQNPARKIVNINGMTASIATVIAMAGDEINISDNALFLIHRASTISFGNINDMRKTVEELEKVDNKIINIYAKKTKKPIADIVAQMNVNNGTGEWLTPQEAKDKGFVHNIFEPSQKMVASADPAMLRALGLPSIPTNKIKPIININTPMKSKTLKQKFDALYEMFAENLGFKNEVKEHKTKDGKTIKIDQAGDEPAVGDAVTDEAGAPTPSASYTMENDNVIKTDADSKISEIEKAVVPESEDGAGGGDDDKGSEPSNPLGETAEVVALKEEIRILKAENKELKELQDSVTEVENEMERLKRLITSKGKPATDGGDTQFRTREIKTGKEISFEDAKARRREQFKKQLPVKK